MLSSIDQRGAASRPAFMSILSLSALNYSEYENEDRFWKVDKLTFGPVNLIVGRNATGKTRCLAVASGLAKLLCGKIKSMFVSGTYDVEFSDHGQVQSYKLTFEHHRVIKEEFTVGGKTMLRRSRGGMGSIFATEMNADMKFQTPDDCLAVVARQDSIQHPFLQRLHDWGAAVRHLEGGQDMGHKTFVIMAKGPPPEPNQDVEQACGYYKDGEKKYGATFKNAIIADMERIGYPIEDIELRKAQDIVASGPITGDLLNIAVKEKDLACWTHQISMSQGMYRVVAQLVNVHHSLLSGKPACFMIDDVGEGLDFERSCSLIDVLRERLAGTESQLIMTTNNRFVMNKIPLEEWTVLQRKGSQVHALNFHNSRERFEEFKFTGLSNFSSLETGFFEGNFPEVPKT
jgi:energy-coupling factor transporter ATP-binding protein EcfA2